ncbi:MAG: thiamine-binding protein [Candidatus Roizmanbacteria bacterium]|nr:thiamine-binding protein [Candidatus Roizmanbacteria bacterium]
MYNSSISFQVLPKAKTDKQMIKIIDQVIKMIEQSGVNYEVGPMETTMEGDLETLFQIVKKAQYLCIKEGAENVFTNIKIIYNPKGVMTIEQKVKKHRIK